MWTCGGVLGAVLLLTGVPTAAGQKKAVFDMEEVSIFDQDELSQLSQPALGEFLLRGQTVACSLEPQTEVKKYPELKSSRPIYGSAVFYRDPIQSRVGPRFFFVIDESSPKEEEKAEDKEKPEETEKSQKTQKTDRRVAVRSFGYPGVGGADQSSASGKYDRMYFDANGDLDLTNDPVLTLMKEPPTQLALPQTVVFDCLTVEIDHGSEVGKVPLKVLPCLMVFGRSRPIAIFTPATARKGTIKLGDDQFTAFLTQGSAISGRFDVPYTGLLLVPTDPSRKTIRRFSGQESLSTLRWIKGEYYDFSATPTGDKLTVAPYSGDTGLLKVSAGDRQGIEKLGVSGVLNLGKRTLPLGDVYALPPAEKLAEHRIPVGDYTPLSLSVDFGPLEVSLARNYYSTEEPYGRMTRAREGGLEISKDKPFLLKFSKKPAMLFTSPSKDRTYKPGDVVQLRAVIVDPDLDLLVRGVDDTTDKLSAYTYRLPGGETVDIPRYRSLEPTVKITDSSGKQVAQGTMPFG